MSANTQPMLGPHKPLRPRQDGYDPGGAFAGVVVQNAPSAGMHG
jgi:hypothetical protein